MSITDFKHEWIDKNADFYDDIADNIPSAGLAPDIATLLNNNAAVYADEFRGRPDKDNAGWKFVNSTAGDKMNWYFLGGNGQTLADIDSFFITAYYRGLAAPSITVYTVRQNDGFDAGSFYRSKISYSTSNGDISSTPPARHVLYTGSTKLVAYEYVDGTELLYEAAFSNGPQDPSEELLFIAVQTDSSEVVNKADFTMDSVGTIIGDRLTLVRLDIASGYPIVEKSGGIADYEATNICLTNAIQLPDNAKTPEAKLILKNLSGASCTVTSVNGAIEGGTTEYVLAANASITVQERNGDWIIISSEENVDLSPSIRTVTASTAAADNELVVVDGDNGAIDITLPAASVGAKVIVKNNITDPINNVTTIVTPNTETIDGQADFIIHSDKQSVTLISDGTNWFII